MEVIKSQELFKRANRVIPGGVNSPARAFKSVGGNPLFIQKAKGAWLWDEDGNRYLDLINSWGPMILGHAHPEIEKAILAAVPNSTSFGAPTIAEIEMAELVAECVPSIEKVRMVNSGTEATMSAIRLARGYTGRDKIIKFEGCYHGHGDSFLIAAGSGLMTHGVPDSAGVTKGVAEDTLTAPYNDAGFVADLCKKNKGEIAAIILEPVVGNMGVVIPEPGFLESLREICDEEGIILIFDEVMTGFRLSLGGAQELFGVTPDLTTLGKIIGGGMPVGAYGGKAEIMDYVSPVGPIYQAGTLSGNPVAMAAGKAMLGILKNNPSIYDELGKNTSAIVNGLRKTFSEHEIPFTINQVGSMFTLFFTNENVNNFQSAKKSDTDKFGKFFRKMLAKGVYMAPSQFEAMFINTEIDQDSIDLIINSATVVLKEDF